MKTRYFAITYDKHGYYIGKTREFNTYRECLVTMLKQYHYTRQRFKILKRLAEV